MVSRSDFSGVWKDGGNVDSTTGAKLNLVEHLRAQRDAVGGFRQAKQKLLEDLRVQLNGCISTAVKPLTYLEIGCGLGEDLMEVANLFAETQRPARIVGLDFNSEMVLLSTVGAEKQAGKLAESGVVVEVHKADILDLLSEEKFPDHSVDFVRCDITLQHVDTQGEGSLCKALLRIRRLLKPQGKFYFIEGGATQFHSADPLVQRVYDGIMPKTTPVGVLIYFLLPEVGFSCHSMEPFPIVTRDFGGLDRDWVKLKGMSQMVVRKGVLTRQAAEEYVEHYIKAAESNQLISIGTLLLTCCVATNPTPAPTPSTTSSAVV